ncbi:MAG: hypothetical protein A4E55_00425 [Pelotomaculum sp. PtaU1.Bin035]|nr:MAG: hypothetical protein A4E55_00425 [Pelotomaculum sp. PtaU1.Bin035]
MQHEHKVLLLRIFYAFTLLLVCLLMLMICPNASMLAAGVALYLLMGFDDSNAEFRSAADDRERGVIVLKRQRE